MRPLLSKYNTYHKVDVRNIDFAIFIHIGPLQQIRINISSQNRVDNGIDIGNVHLTIPINVTPQQ